MKHTRLVWAIALALASIADYPKQVHAQLTQSNNNTYESAQQGGFEQPEAPPDAPDGRRRGTGSRDYTANLETGGNITLTPLIPLNPWGYTTEKNPVIWIHIDYSGGKANQEISAKLSLQDPSTNKELLPKLMSVKLPQESGAFKIQLPYSLPPGKMYRWYLVLDDCGDFVDGWVRRFENPELQHQLAEVKTAQERYSLYLQNGIWYDLLNEAANIRCSNSQNASVDDRLATLLSNQNVNLEDIAQARLICS